MNSFVRRAFGCLAIAALLSSPALAPAVEVAKEPAAKPRPARPAKQPDASWDKYHAEFCEQAKAGGYELLFMGDSITRGWRGARDVWEKSFNAFKPANFGIGGDRTEHVLWRIENGEFEGTAPKAVVLLIGTNNTACGHAPEDTAEGIKTIVETIKSKCPQAKVLLLAVLPRGETAQDEKRQKNDKINAIIAKLDDGGKTVKFLDIGPKFLGADGGLLKDAYNPDFLHLNHKGYEIMAGNILPAVKELMGSGEKGTVEKAN